ncbi:unnamed protein product [Prunus armeniaca]
MAYRGRGRGGFGGGGGGFGYAIQVPFEVFPDVDLPNVKGIFDPEKKVNKGLSEEENLVNQSLKFQKIWKGSLFYLEQTTSKERQNTEVERYSDRLKPKTTIRSGALFVILELKGFPQELTGGSRAQQPGRKRVRWNPDSELQKLDLFEKLEQRQCNNDGKEKKEGEEEEEAEEDFSDDDYQKNQDFDDDDDDFNMEDDGDGRNLSLIHYIFLMNLFCSETVLHMRLLQTYTNLPHFSSTKWSIQLLFVFL